jgi:hypothetical protein
MLRRWQVFIFLFAALLVAEPILHSHPLRQSIDGSTSGSTCAICASGVGRLPIVAASVAAPQVVIYAVATAPVMIAAAAPLPPIASRAPPAF